MTCSFWKMPSFQVRTVSFMEGILLWRVDRMTDFFTPKLLQFFQTSHSRKKASTPHRQLGSPGNVDDNVERNDANTYSTSHSFWDLKSKMPRKLANLNIMENSNYLIWRCISHNKIGDFFHCHVSFHVCMCWDASFPNSHQQGMTARSQNFDLATRQTSWFQGGPSWDAGHRTAKLGRKKRSRKKIHILSLTFWALGIQSPCHKMSKGCIINSSASYIGSLTILRRPLDFLGEVTLELKNDFRGFGSYLVRIPMQKQKSLTIQQVRTQTTTTAANFCCDILWIWYSMAKHICYDD